MTLPPLNLDRVLALADAIGLHDAELRIYRRQPNDGSSLLYRVTFYATGRQTETTCANTIEVAVHQFEEELERQAAMLLREREASAKAMKDAIAMADQRQGSGE